VSSPRRLACGDQVALWDLTTRRPLTGLPIATTEALAFSPTANLLAVGTRNAAGRPGIDAWDVSAGKVTKTLARETEVRSVCASASASRPTAFDGRLNSIRRCCLDDPQLGEAPKASRASE
jgi:hypothetical protein